MAEFTVTLRTLCENYWLTTHPEYSIPWMREVNYRDIIDNAWQYIFDFSFPIWLEADRKKLCTDIIMHYYNREIGMETYMLWKQRLDTRMNEIMPYYNKLFQTESSMGNPFENIDITIGKNRAGNENKDDTSTKTGSSNTAGEHSKTGNISAENETTSSQDTSRSVNNHATTEETGSTTNTNLFSDTPQNGLTNVINGEYLTSATVDNGNISNSSTTDASESETGSQTMETKGTASNTNSESGTEKSGHEYNDDYSFNSKKDYSEWIQESRSGFEGDKVETLIKYRESILQIPKMIINDLQDLFISILF